MCLCEPEKKKKKRLWVPRLVFFLFFVSHFSQAQGDKPKLGKVRPLARQATRNEPVAALHSRAVVFFVVGERIRPKEETEAQNTRQTNEVSPLSLSHSLFFALSVPLFSFLSLSPCELSLKREWEWGEEEQRTTSRREHFFFSPFSFYSESTNSLCALLLVG